jgi:putative membrane protein
MAREPLVKSALLFGLSGYLTHILLSGKITGYIHPRFISFTWFAVAGFAVMGVALLLASLQQRERPIRPVLYAAILCPLLLGLAVPPTTFGAELVARQGINLVPRQRSRVAVATPRADARPSTAVIVQPGGTAAPGTGAPGSAPGSASGSTSGSAPGSAPGGGALPAPGGSQAAAGQEPAGGSPGQAAPGSQAAPPAGEPPRQPQAESRAGGQAASVLLTDKNMFHLLAEIYEYPQRYYGARVEMTGFVFHVDDLASDEFALVRLIVTCHVAHAVPDGFIAIHAGAPGLKVDSWYRAVGVFEAGTYQGKETIKIRLTELTAVEMPKDPYIYP